jgi:acetate kinase
MSQSPQALLVINAGSSSVKFSVYSQDSLQLIVQGQVEGIGLKAHYICNDGQGQVTREFFDEQGHIKNHGDAFDLIEKNLHTDLPGMSWAAVGHRVVHGGAHFQKPVLISPQNLKELQTLEPLAPLHQPHNLAMIKAIAQLRPELPQVACFDTSFHRSHGPMAELLGLPYELYEQGIRRYGFHGLSYEYIARSLPTVAPDIARGKVIVAHLGNGASLCALDGLLMGTRTGRLDPGVVLYLQDTLKMSARELETLLYKKSGLLGLSGISSDMRDLLHSSQARAQLAIDYFVYRVVQEICGLAGVLQGFEALVFTAGIGEHAAPIREKICAALAWLGVQLQPDPAPSHQENPHQASPHQARCISSANSRVPVWVIPTNEELMIAQHTQELLYV